MGINEDRRGSNHIKVALPFDNNCSITDGITFFDFIREIYKLKSHKFENNYEL